MNEYSDHDLLVIISERTRVFGEDMTSIKDRVTALERRADTQSGFFSGAKALWGLILAVPTGALGTILGVMLSQN